jgi:hypothetical protein
MTTATLTKIQKNMLRRSSRTGVGNSFGQLQRHVLHQRWLGKGNRYSVNTVNRLKKDLEPGRSINSGHLSQYIAASAPLHCSDGWTYLGRAMICHARGDSPTALHLAYYAELRAAVAILAAEGIGIFSRQHFVVDEDSNCQRIPNPQHGTHVITWLALEHWAELRRSSELVTSIIAPGTIPLSEWLTRFGATVTTGGLVTSQMLKHWGLDLKHLSEDRDARNEASYRPDRLVQRAALNANEVSEFLRNFWQLLEPLPASPFEVLDRHLLRVTLEEVYAAIIGRSAANDRAGFAVAVDRMLNGMSPSGLSAHEWKQFLTRSTAPSTPQLLGQAAGREKSGSPIHHMQVMSRAGLLLRVATGACGQLIRTAPFAGPDLQFWWSRVGDDLGIWNPITIPTQLADLWADIESALEELQNWESENPSLAGSIVDWWFRLSNPISLLGTTERVGLWGLGI